jgi:hypothetical protein
LGYLLAILILIAIHDHGQIWRLGGHIVWVVGWGGGTPTKIIPGLPVCGLVAAPGVPVLSEA